MPGRDKSGPLGKRQGRRRGLGPCGKEQSNQQNTEPSNRTTGNQGRLRRGRRLSDQAAGGGDAASGLKKK
jgi:hypothetical protein